MADIEGAKITFHSRSVCFLAAAAEMKSKRKEKSRQGRNGRKVLPLGLIAMTSVRLSYSPRIFFP